MDKTCNNCYWRNEHAPEETCCVSFAIPKDNTCEHFAFECNECKDEIAEMEYNNKKYCEDCLKEELEIEIVPIMTYWRNGECIGDDSEGFASILQKVNGSVKEL